jgi:hypothetical protein
MSTFDMKALEKAVFNVRARIVKGELGANPLYKKAADSYARLFELHEQQMNLAKQMQELDNKQQGINNEVMRIQGGMEVMEGMLAEELINSGETLQDIDMPAIAKMAGEQLRARREATVSTAEEKPAETVTPEAQTEAAETK